MKERIVNNYGAEIKSICCGCAEGVKQKCKQTQKDHLQCALQYSKLKDFKVEQVPETFEELKKLCKQTGHYAIDIIHNGSGLFYKDSIYVFNLTFRDNGEIDDNENNTVAENRTPAQMWQIIKSLVEE